MDISIFTNKLIVPENGDLMQVLGTSYKLWEDIKKYVYEKYPAAFEEWNYPGVKYGWSFRLKDKKRAILYFLPREKYFMVAFVFGQKATDIILQSGISDEIKSELGNGRVYAEGRGIRLTVKNENHLNDIKKLIEIKISN